MLCKIKLYVSLDYGFLTIVLPWQVLQELDCMKKNDTILGYRAREATRWLLEILSKNHPRLKGQPMTKKIKTDPDDAILNCAIIVKERVNTVVSELLFVIKSSTIKGSVWCTKAPLCLIYNYIIRGYFIAHIYISDLTFKIFLFPVSRYYKEKNLQIIVVAGNLY